MRGSSLRFLILISKTTGRLRPKFVCHYLLLLQIIVVHSHLLRGQAGAPAAGARVIHGVVKSGNMPIPGAGVSAENATTKEQVNTWTDVDGSYSLRIPADGHYTVRVQMAAFAASTQEVVLDATHPDVQANFELILLSRAREAAARIVMTVITRSRSSGANAGGRGFQNLSVFQSGGGTGCGLGGSSMSDVVPSGMPVPGIAPDSATESVAVSGNTSNSFNAMSADEMQQRFNDARQQGGGFGGGADSVAQAAGVWWSRRWIRWRRSFGRRGFDINRPHGSIYYGVGDSALNASPFALTGQPSEKPAYLQNSFGGSVGGPLNIPQIYHGGSKTFYFINYNGKRGENPFDQFSTVPTLLERQGNFSGSRLHFGDADERGQTIQIYNPVTNDASSPSEPGFHKPVSTRPAHADCCITFRCPNLPGNYQNFHYVTSATSDSDDLNVRVNHSFGAAPAGGAGAAEGPQRSAQQPDVRLSLPRVEREH